MSCWHGKLDVNPSQGCREQGAGGLSALGATHVGVTLRGVCDQIVTLQRIGVGIE